MLYHKHTGSLAGFQDLRMIAHDMRAPLHALSLSVHAARRQNRNPEAVATLLDLAERNIQMLSTLIENILAAQIGNGRPPQVFHECEPHGLVMRALDQVTALAAEKGLHVEAAEMLALPPLAADADGLVRVLVNLLVNAVKFTPAGGQIRVSVKLRINDGHRVLVFSVTDDGVGVAPDQIDRIFLAGISLSVEGNHSTGLGLAVSRAIVEAHGGRIWVETGRSRGAKFSFSIPTDPPAPAFPIPS
jgi:signal transduction histidine kinase